MRTVIATIIFAAVILVIFVYWSREHQPFLAMPLVKASTCVVPTHWQFKQRRIA